MGARKQADLTPEQYVVADALCDLRIEAWHDISQEAREEAARACYPATIVEQLERLPCELRERMQGTILVGGEAPRYLQVPYWPELRDRPRLSVFQTPDEIHKALAKCDDFIRAGNHFRAHHDMEHVWKILSSSARRSLQARLEQRASSGGSWPE
jgi:hypothetical protein